MGQISDGVDEYGGDILELIQMMIGTVVVARANEVVGV